MMTLHPLTKLLINKCYPVRPLTIPEGIIQSWAKERAIWLKNELCAEGYKTTIDQAFQLEPETLEEKFHIIRRKHRFTHSCPEDFWKAVCKELARAAEEHFAPKPSEAIDKTPPLHLRTQPGWKG